MKILSITLSLLTTTINYDGTLGVEYEHPLRASSPPLGCDQVEEGCPVCEAPERTCKTRIRKSWSRLDDSEKHRFIDALHVIKWTTAEEGKRLYGEKFVRYDELILHHATAENDPRGDQAHLAQHFTQWHRLFVLKAENSILSVDPEIGALPYLDLREGIDAFFGDSPMSFGSTTGTGLDSSVVDGAFANWTVSEYDDYLQTVAEERGVSQLFEGLFSNITGRTLLRTTDVPTNSIVRYPTCPAPVGPEAYSSKDHDACLKTSNFEDFYWCLESPLANGAHELTHFYIGSADSPEMGFGCPDFAPPLIKATGTRQGDFLDKSTSVNDPMFFLHHAYVDMLVMEFMRLNPDGDNYWSYQAGRKEDPANPVDGTVLSQATRQGDPVSPVDGTMLYDTVNDMWPFYGSDVFGNDDSDIPQGALKYWEVLCWVNPETSFYTYDVFGDTQCSEAVEDQEAGPSKSSKKKKHKSSKKKKNNKKRKSSKKKSSKSSDDSSSSSSST